MEHKPNCNFNQTQVTWLQHHRVYRQSLPICLSAPLPTDLQLVQSASLSVNNVLVAALLGLDTSKQQIVCPHSSVARALVS